MLFYRENLQALSIAYKLIAKNIVFLKKSAKVHLPLADNPDEELLISGYLEQTTASKNSNG